MSHHNIAKTMSHLLLAALCLTIGSAHAQTKPLTKTSIAAFLADCNAVLRSIAVMKSPGQSQDEFNIDAEKSKNLALKFAQKDQIPLDQLQMAYNERWEYMRGVYKIRGTQQGQRAIAQNAEYGYECRKFIRSQS